jgi:hypothetical protein
VRRKDAHYSVPSTGIVLSIKCPTAMPTSPILLARAKIFPVLPLEPDCRLVSQELTQPIVELVFIFERSRQLSDQHQCFVANRRGE